MQRITSCATVAAALAIPGPVASQDAATTDIDRTLLPYASIENSVQLSDGRTIHLVCMGEGTPSVILTAGVADWSIAWNRIQPSIAAGTRVCSWDRAGHGLSDPPAKPQLVDATTADLEAALAAGQVEPPYILVGHSVGGYESLLFADRHPAQVAGMVLVDPQYPDEVRIMARVTPATTEFSDRMSKEYPSPLAELAKKCSAALRAGTLRKDGPDPDGCLQPQWPASYPSELTAALSERLATASTDSLAAAFDTLAATNSLELLDANARLAVNPRRDYASMPLVVLTHDEANVPPGLPEAVKAELPAGSAEWRRAHRELAALSTRGVDRIIEGSGHDFPQENPQAVIDAILEVTEEVRSTGQSAEAAEAEPAAIFAGMSDTEIASRVEAVIDEIRTRPEFVGLSVAVARGDQLIVDRGYGIADLEWNAPADASTIFRIGSLTKQFTAAAIMKLAEQGKLALDDPLSRYVPDFDTGGRVVTIRQMLNHTSGIPEYTLQPGFFTKMAPLDLSEADLLQFVSGKPFDFEPGAGWRYSNTNYLLLGMVIAKASGQTYATFMQDEFFTPLGLDKTRYASETAIIPHRAQGYSFDPDTESHANDAAISMTAPGGGGALASSAGDLVRWQIALTGGLAISPASFEQMIGSPVKTGRGDSLYGFGIGIERRDGQRVIEHTGGINGFNSVLSWLPDIGLRIAMISNSEAMPSFSVERRIIAALTSEVPPAPRTMPHPGSEAALRKFIADIVAGTPDYSTMSPLGAQMTRTMLPQLQETYDQLGPLRALTFEGVTLQDFDSYRAEFANGAVIYTIFLAPDGTIGTMNFRPLPPDAK